MSSGYDYYGDDRIYDGLYEEDDDGLELSLPKIADYLRLAEDDLLNREAGELNPENPDL